MGTFFATHEAELYHYGRKGMRRGRHLPDVLDPTRALVGRFSPISRSLGTMAEFGQKQSRGPHKTSRDYSVEYRTRHRVAHRQEEAKREAERNAAKNAIARGYTTKTASRATASGAATGNAVRELNRQVGQERLRRSVRGASSGSSRSAYENNRTERAVNAQKQRIARAAERYNSNLGNVSGGAQQARKKSEDARTQNSRTKKLQKEARETRERNGEIRRILDYNARVWMPKYLSEEAQTRSAKVIRDKENRKTQESKKQFQNMPKWKQNLERAKSQKAASDKAEFERRKKLYKKTHSQGPKPR